MTSTRKTAAKRRSRPARNARGRMHVEESSGSVFADLGLPDAEERLVKADLALEIGRILQQRQLTQRAAAELMGIDQPKVSHLLRGRLAGYSTERLLHFLTAPGATSRSWCARRPGGAKAGYASWPPSPRAGFTNSQPDLCARATMRRHEPEVSLGVRHSFQN